MKGGNNMFGFLVVFAITYVIGFILGFIDGFTNGGLKWILLAGVVLFFFWLVSNLGLGFGTLAFFAIVALVIRGIWKYLVGALQGFMSFFTHKW